MCIRDSFLDPEPELNKNWLKNNIDSRNNLTKIENYKELKISDYFREASWDEVIEISAKNLNLIYSENSPVRDITTILSGKWSLGIP